MPVQWVIAGGQRSIVNRRPSENSRRLQEWIAYSAWHGMEGLGSGLEGVCQNLSLEPRFHVVISLDLVVTIFLHVFY